MKDIKQLINPSWRKNTSYWRLVKNLLALLLLTAFYYYLNINF